MNGQLFVSYCAQYGDSTDLCDARKQSRNCLNCPYNKWVIRIPQRHEEQRQNNSTES